MNRIKARRWKKRWLLYVRLVAFLTILLATSSCSTSTTGTGQIIVQSDSTSFCNLYYPVYYDLLLDSPETIGRINVNNSLYEQCPF